MGLFQQACAGLFAINTSCAALQVKQEKHQQQLHEQGNALRDGLRQVANDYAGRKELTDGALPAWPCWKWLSAV